jgi:copper homeostasis protein
MRRIIEVCSCSVDAVMEAAAGGATRVELCSLLSCGGITPSAGLIRKACAACGQYGLQLHVLIRPREGDFVYSESELQTMLEDVRFCSEAGVDGVVMGALTKEGTLDVDACRRLVEAAGTMHKTFHRAFDICTNPSETLEQIISLGFDRLLTSGQKPDALSGASLIASLVKQSAGRIIIMPGAGINPANIAEIQHLTGAAEFHSSARAPITRTGTEKGSEAFGTLSELRTSREVVHAMVYGD